MGLVAIVLLQPGEFEMARKHSLDCSMVVNPTMDVLGGIWKAWNGGEHHDQLVQAYEQRIREMANAGYERLIFFSGDRAGLDDAKELANCGLPGSHSRHRDWRCRFANRLNARTIRNMNAPFCRLLR